MPDGQQPLPADEERLTTINYGGGARWFAKPHLAFTFDVRFHGHHPGTPQGGLPGSPRMTMLIIGAGRVAEVRNGSRLAACLEATARASPGPSQKSTIGRTPEMSDADGHR